MRDSIFKIHALVVFVLVSIGLGLSDRAEGQTLRTPRDRSIGVKETTAGNSDLRPAAEPSANTEHVIEWSLRAGYDSNALDSSPRRASLAAGVGLAYRFARDDGERALAVTGEAQTDLYEPDVLDRATFLRGSLDHATPIAGAFAGGRLSQRFVAGFVREVEDGARRTSFALRQRLEWRRGALKIFANAEGRLVALNEENLLFDGFLPRGEESVTAQVTPGIAWTDDENELGLSLGLGRTRLLAGTDYLGLDKDQRRIQPYLFGGVAIGPARLQGAVSLLSLRFDRSDFDAVRRVLYDLTLSWPIGPVQVDLALAQAVRETTFPTASLDISETLETRASMPLSERDVVGVFLRTRRKLLEGPDLAVRTTAFGVELARRLDEGVAATASLFVRHVRADGSEPTASLNVALGISKRLALP